MHSYTPASRRCPHAVARRFIPGSRERSPMTGDRARYGSDVIVDLLSGQGIRYVALNPGASFRGLHDSLVNRSDAPDMILVPHEKLAVNIAHGFAKASGEPMVAILHDTVGLLHGALGIFTAFLDRTPVIVLGGAGPMDTARRRPWIDWIHTSSIQGNAVRDYTKWDDQPASVEAMPEAFVRARQVALSEPAGPVYIALDADLQEKPISGGPPAVDWVRSGPARPIAPEPAGLAEAVRLLVEAKRPVLVGGYAGRDPRAFDWIPELAEVVGAGIVDLDNRLNAPTNHPLNVTGTKALEQADLVVLLDHRDVSRTLLTTDPPAREVRSRVAADCRIVDIGFNDHQVSAWVHDVGPAVPIDLRLTADTSLALPMLLDAAHELVRDEPPDRAAERATRRESLTRDHEQQRAA